MYRSFAGIAFAHSQVRDDLQRNWPSPPPPTPGSLSPVPRGPGRSAGVAGRSRRWLPGAGRAERGAGTSSGSMDSGFPAMYAPEHLATAAAPAEERGQGSPAPFSPGRFFPASLYDEFTVHEGMDVALEVVCPGFFGRCEVVVCLSRACDDLAYEDLF